jgi:hypothetical protein
MMFLYVQYVQGLYQFRLGTANYALLSIAQAAVAILEHLDGRTRDSGQI